MLYYITLLGLLPGILGALVPTKTEGALVPRQTIVGCPSEFDVSSFLLKEHLAQLSHNSTSARADPSHTYPVMM